MRGRSALLYIVVFVVVFLFFASLAPLSQKNDRSVIIRDGTSSQSRTATTATHRSLTQKQLQLLQHEQQRLQQHEEEQLQQQQQQQHQPVHTQPAPAVASTGSATAGSGRSSSSSSSSDSGSDADSTRACLTNARFHIITAGSTAFAPMVKNLIGSIHKWEPGVSITVYDLGFDKPQADEVRQLCNTELKSVDFTGLPAHVKKLDTFAWKPLILTDALKSNECVLYLDAGTEVRRPLTSIRRDLGRDGYWYSTTGSAFPNRFTHKGAYSYFEVTADSYPRDGIEVAGTFQGYVRGSVATRTILEPLLECELLEACATPPGASRENFRQDQTLVNMLLYHPSRGLVAALARHNPHGSKSSSEPVSPCAQNVPAAGPLVYNARMVNQSTYSASSCFVHMEFKYWSFHQNGQLIQPQPTRSADTMNEVVLYTRRRFGGALFTNLARKCAAAGVTSASVG